ARRRPLRGPALRVLPAPRLGWAPSVLPVHPQVLRARIPRALPPAQERLRHARRGAERALGRRLSPHVVAHAAVAPAPVLDHARERLGAAAGGPMDRVVRAERQLRKLCEARREASLWIA